MKLTLLAACSIGLAAVAAAFAGGCTGEDTPPKFFDGGDASSDVSSDAPSEAPSEAATTTHGKIIAVHASPDLPAIRLCFGVGLQNDGSDATIAPTPPLPKAGVAPGTGAALADLGDLSQRALTPYVVVASKIPSAGAACDTLLSAAGGLVSGTDYFALPTIKNGTFASMTTHLVAIIGCLGHTADSLADITTCGETYDAAKGNLATAVFTLDRVVVNTQRFGAQIAHVASPASGVWNARYGATAMSAALHPLDGGADEPITDAVMVDSIAPPGAASLAMPTVDSTSLVVSAVNPDGGAPPVSTSIPLPLVYEATTGQATGEKAYFAPGVNYTFVVVGDPRASTTLDGGVFNGYSLHALAFPNDPPLP